MEDVTVSFPDGTLSHLEKLEASAHKVALKKEKIREHEEKVLRMKMKIQELRRQRDELKTKLNVCRSQLIAGKDVMKNCLQVSKTTKTSQQAILEWKIENAKCLLEFFHLTGLSGKLTQQGISLCISTAFEGIYLDSYYLDILVQQPLQIQHHSIPVFIPLEQIAHEHLQKDIKRFLSILSDHLNAYARRKFQVEQLQEHFAVFLEGSLKGNSLYNQLDFNYRVTESGNFPFAAGITYGNPMSAFPTNVTVLCKEVDWRETLPTYMNATMSFAVCEKIRPEKHQDMYSLSAEDAPTSGAKMAAAHLALFYEKPLQEVFISITASAKNLSQTITPESSFYSTSGGRRVASEVAAL